MSMIISGGPITRSGLPCNFEPSPAQLDSCSIATTRVPVFLSKSRSASAEAASTARSAARHRLTLAGRLEWAIGGRFGDKSSGLTLALRPSGAELIEVSLYLPLEPFIAQHPRLKAVRIGALLHATTSRIARNVPASASIDVDGLFSPMVPLASQLGNYRFDVDLDAAGKGAWRATTLAGILAVSGGGSLDTNAQQIAGKLVLTPSTTLPGLSPALSQLPRSGDGYLVTF